MAPVFTAKSCGPKDITPPLFHLKGVKNKYPVNLGAINLFARPLYLETAFVGYRSFIEAFIYATSIQRKVVASAEGYPSFSPRGLLPIRTPLLSFALAQNLSSDQSNRLVAKLTRGSVEKQGKTMVYSCDNAPNDLFTGFIDTQKAPHFNPPGNAVNPDGLKSYLFLIGAIHEFLATHTYPAFRAPQRLEKGQYPVEINATLGSHEVPVSYWTKASVAKNGIDVSNSSFNKLHPQAESMDIDESASVAEGSTTVTKHAQYVATLDEEKLRGYLQITGNDSVYVAKPSPAAATMNYGSVSRIPRLPGLVFPYFHNMIRPSPSELLEYSSATFFRLMGEDLPKCRERYQEFKRGCSSLSKTETGMALTHIMLMIRLALDTQARLYVVLESGEYKGSVLLGSGFSLHDGSSWVLPIDDVHVDLSFLDPTTRSLAALTSKLSELAIESKYTGPTLDSSYLDQPSKFDVILSGIQVDILDPKTIAELNTLFQGLNLRGDSFVNLDPTTILGFVREFGDGKDKVLSKPTFIPSCRTDVTDRAFILLSKFGPEAPSFWNERGTEFYVPKDHIIASASSSKRKIGEIDSYTRPDEIHAIPKPLEIAVRDWKKVVSSRSIKMDLKERARGHRTIGMKSPLVIDPLWSAFIDCLPESDDIVVVPKKQKVDTTASFSDAVSKFL